LKDAQPLIDQAQVKMEVFKRKSDELNERAGKVEHKILTTYHNSKWLIYPVALLVLIPYLALVKYLLLTW